MKKFLLKLIDLFAKRFWYNYMFESERHFGMNHNYNTQTLKRFDNPIYLENFGFKVFSQNDEDGIIEEIFKRINTSNKSFIEFGVQNGLESNAHFLIHKGWRGLWIEGDKKMSRSIEQIFNKPIKENRLRVINKFITRENIDSIIKDQMQFLCENGEIDLLSIDIDGNDYHVWNAIKCISPRVVVIEYNAKFPPNFEWVMEYNSKHIWKYNDKHGASLKSLENLGKILNYQLVGTNICGTNAFFVRNDLVQNHFCTIATSENLYNPWRTMKLFQNGHPCNEYIGK